MSQNGDGFPPSFWISRENKRRTLGVNTNNRLANFNHKIMHGAKIVKIYTSDRYACVKEHCHTKAESRRNFEQSLMHRLQRPSFRSERRTRAPKQRPSFRSERRARAPKQRPSFRSERRTRTLKQRPSFRSERRKKTIYDIRYTIYYILYTSLRLHLGHHVC